jgi:hypothetical protein
MCKSASLLQFGGANEYSTVDFWGQPDRPCRGTSICVDKSRSSRARGLKRKNIFYLILEFFVKPNTIIG